jgi:hypothetical protein
MRPGRGSTDGPPEPEEGDDCPAVKEDPITGHLHSCDSNTGFGHRGAHHCLCGYSWQLQDSDGKEGLPWKAVTASL